MKRPNGFNVESPRSMASPARLFSTTPTPSGRSLRISSAKTEEREFRT
jgi:hypothetical protein